ncbi:uncharacterized protein LOC122672684 [Telopea speciosissima]|uniref:uncharacterized protein LOC122672684 n=1 Tax=Telopea speciosissima TaxID=54955 RepID=UPI001CC577EC|nr:uncharacterized protein LOC122672684 [Telopea speciosissima]
MESVGWEEEEEWELCNDGDFVYKRRKRRQDLSAAATAPPTSDPEAEQRQLRERKKRALLKLKEQYQNEIDQWQRMSHTLQAMDTRAQPQPFPSPPSSSSATESAKLPPPELDSSCRQLIDDLVLQAKAQEAIVQDLSNLCETVETLCKAEEERVKQSFIDLPIWATPSALVASLSDD